MAVYNGERFIQEQLDSFLKQTRLPDEVVVSDNASTDRTVEIVRDFAASVPFTVRLLVNHRNLGVTKNFERAIRECVGDIIFLSDCDDVWYPEKLSRMERAFAANPRAGLVICDGDLVDENLQRLGCRVWRAQGFRLGRRERKFANGSAFTPRLPALGNCMAFRAQLAPLFLPFPEDQRFRQGWHDYFIAWIIICSGAASVALVQEPLLAYRKHGRNVSGAAQLSFASRLRRRWSGRREKALQALPAVVERLKAIPDSVGDRFMRLQAIRHWQSRCGLTPSRFGRIAPIFTELASLRYHRFSNGFLTAAKDLLFVR